jgi:hypothetical protein
MGVVMGVGPVYAGVLTPRLTAKGKSKSGNLHGNCVLITRASRRLGLALARRFWKKGRKARA